MRFLFILLFIFTKFAKTREVLILTEENPSFAIHGVNLFKEKNFSLIGCKNCTFLIDFTQKDCRNEKETNYFISLKEDNIEDRITFCNDQIPFLVNHESPKCQGNQEMLPYDEAFEYYFYFCSFKIENESRVDVEILKKAENFEFAISFRVAEWVDTSKKVLVLPANPDLTAISLIREDTIATVVTHSTNANGPTLELMLGGYYTTYCDNYLPDITCGKQTSFFAYHGSIAGKMKAENYYQMEFYPRPISLRSSAISIFTNESCSFCLRFSAAITFDSYVLDYQSVSSMQPIFTNSFAYPWFFDDSSIYNESLRLDFSYIYANYDLTATKIEVISIRNGLLNMAGYSHSEVNSMMRCDKNVLIFNKTLISPLDDFSFEDRIVCLTIQWHPYVNDTDAKKGFFISIRPFYSPPDNPKYLADYELTENDPILILHASNLANFGADKLPVRIRNIRENCSILVDISRSCGYAKNPSIECINGTPFVINGEQVNNDQCVSSYRQSSHSIHQRCHFSMSINMIFLYIRVQSLIDEMRSSISFRVKEWINESTSFQLEAVDISTGVDLAFVAENSTIPTWIGISLVNHLQLRILKTLKWDRTLTPCHYKFLIGPPPGLKPYESRKIIEFHDEDRFIEQYLESSVYSVLIPPGCLPKILIGHGTCSYPLWLDEVQELCRGSTFVTTMGYRMRYENIPPSYYLRRQITCSTFPVDIIVELVDLFTGKLTIQFQTASNTATSIQISEVAVPIVYVARYVHSVTILWESYTPMIFEGGCFLRVHVERADMAIVFGPTESLPITKPLSRITLKYVLLLTILWLILCL